MFAGPATTDTAPRTKRTARFRNVFTNVEAIRSPDISDKEDKSDVSKANYFSKVIRETPVALERNKG